MSTDEAKKGLHPTAYDCPEGTEYVPYVRADDLAEFTLKSLLCGITLGVVFGAANAYLGLMAGLTISTSIPVAVLTVVVFRALGAAGVQHTILEANLSQTVGSASSSVASGVLFTIPALFMWGLAPELQQLTLLAMSGGLVGVLAMIPLRRYLIKREHGKLPYPEGLACAEVLVASKEGGSQASGVFYGLGLGFLMKGLTKGLHWLPETFQYTAGKVAVAVKVSPALIGVGYILGPRVATVMVSGAALSSFVIVPIVAWLGADSPWWGANLEGVPADEAGVLIRDMSVGDLWDKYVRYIGAGAVAAAGIITLVRSLPLMVESFRVGLSQIGKSSAAGRLPRVDRDLPFVVVVVGVLAILLTLIFAPGVLGAIEGYGVKALAALLIAVFAFFFVTVASRIVGMVGVTSNPTSGMTIATLLGTSVIFWLLGWTDTAGKATALMVGTVVCIASSIAGDTSQDLKTGFLLGATPKKQQIGELIGVLTSAVFVCWTVVALNDSLTLGSKELPAPQSVLMKLVIDGVIDQNLPWSLIGIGAAIAIVAFLCRLPALAFAVGVYLPLSTMAPVFLGGLLAWILGRGRDPKVAAERRERGVLFGSGMVGGEGLVGVAIAIFVLLTQSKKGDEGTAEKSWLDELTQLQVSGLALLGIGGILIALALFATRRNRAGSATST